MPSMFTALPGCADAGPIPLPHPDVRTPDAACAFRQFHDSSGEASTSCWYPAQRGLVYIH